jgi:hypothetical protein
MNLTISLDEQLAAQLRQEASAGGVSAEQAASELLGGVLQTLTERSTKVDPQCAQEAL